MRRTSIQTGCVLMLGACLGGTGWQPVEESAARDIRAFRPSANGFAFVNHFTGSPIPFSLGGLENKIGTPSAFGLCGGMSFAAADMFFARRTPPVRSTPPNKAEGGLGAALFDYLQQRQMATFGAEMWLAARFGRWMSLPDTGPLGTRTMTIGELDDIRDGLSAGKPIVLGLVFNHHAANKDASGPAGVPWENHQVLAYDTVSTPGQVSVRIYDPNYPKQDDVFIHCRTHICAMVTVGPWGGVQAPLMGVECERAVGTRRPTKVRGLFVMPYAGAVPPEKME